MNQKIGLSIPRSMVALFLVVLVILLSGCATRTLVPLPDGAKVDVERRSATQTSANVTVTVVGSAWKGEPVWLNEYVTPVYAVVENRGSSPIRFGYSDLVIFDERRVQYPALAPETVAVRVQSTARHYEAVPPPSLFISNHFVMWHAALHRPFRPWWYDPFWPWPYHPWPYHPYRYAPPRVSDIYAEALPVGSVWPHARVQGFIYFTRLPATAQRVTISIGYEESGEGRREVTFPFAVQSNGSASKSERP